MFFNIRMVQTGDELVTVYVNTDSDWFHKFNCGKFLGRRFYFTSSYYNLNPWEVHIPANNMFVIHQGRAYRLLQYLVKCFNNCEGFSIDIDKLFGNDGVELATGGEINNVLRS